MKKTGIFGLFAGLMAVVPCAVDAAYPVYQQPVIQQPVVVQGAPVQVQNGVVRNAVVQQVPQVVPVQQSGSVVYLPTNNNGVVTANAVTAARPSRVTGALPRVGSSATTAGRQYYQPADYDRLADSGLYIGLSAAYTASLMGKISAEYSGETDSYVAPGAFREANWKSDTMIPLQVSVGAAINSDLRIDFSYLRYSGLSYPQSVETSDGAGGFVASKTDGGAITANTAMLNVYYNIDSFTGYIAGGSLRPYIGAGVGISFNTIADYVVYDNSFYAIVDDPAAEPAGSLTGISDVYGYHNGGSTEQLAFMFEAGVTTNLTGGLSLDFFGRYANLGQIKTSGSIVVSQTDWLATGDGIPPYEAEAPYDDVSQLTNWRESGRLSMIDVGVRLRLQF